MAFTTEPVLTGVKGAHAAELFLGAKSCPGRWANTHVNTYSTNWNEGLNLLVTSSGFRIIDPGLYTISWKVRFNDTLVPPNLGNQTWIELYGQTVRYGLGATDQNSSSDPLRASEARGAVSLSIGTSTLFELWVCNGHNSSRTTLANGGTWITIMKHPS